MVANLFLLVIHLLIHTVSRTDFAHDEWEDDIVCRLHIKVALICDVDQLSQTPVLAYLLIQVAMYKVN